MGAIYRDKNWRLWTDPVFFMGRDWGILFMVPLGSRPEKNWVYNGLPWGDQTQHLKIHEKNDGFTGKIIYQIYQWGVFQLALFDDPRIHHSNQQRISCFFPPASWGSLDFCLQNARHVVLQHAPSKYLLINAKTHTKIQYTQTFATYMQHKHLHNKW